MKPELRKAIMSDLRKQAIKESIKRHFRHKIRFKNKYKKAIKITPPRYDEVYYKGVEWLNSL